MRRLLAGLLLLAAPASAAFFQGGIGVGTAVGPVTAATQNGQTFISWPDQATGATGDTWRYEVYESASALTSDNCTSATKVGTLLSNNGAQLLGGNPDTGGSTYTQAHRQDAAVETVALSLLGTPYLPNYGLFARTIPSNRTEHYCVMAVDNPANSGSHSPTYIGSVGPVTEVAASIQPIQLRDSFSRSALNASQFTILGTPSAIGVEFQLHASTASGGTCYANSQLGDFWLMFGDPTMGPQDGTPVVFCGLQPHTRSPNVLTFSHRNTRWATTFEIPLSPEAEHTSFGAIPSAQTRAAYSSDTNPHVYPFDARRLKYIWDFIKGHYNVGTNNWVLWGQSLGAYGTLQIGVREYPTYFAMCASVGGSSRMYSDIASGGWPTIPSTQPFGAALGSNPAAVTLQDGTTVWGGTGGWQDLPTAVANSTSDLCPILMSNAVNDTTIAFSGAKTFSTSFTTGKQFHAFAWNNGTHSDIAAPMFALWKQFGAAHAWSYDEGWFKTNVALPVFSSAGFDDDPNSDTVGCVNCGWQWSNTADASGHIAFSIQNNWMARNPGTLQSGKEPSGPQHGPFSTTTADITIGRRAQTWAVTPTTGTATCTNTPNGGSPAVQVLTADSNGLVTFMGAIVNSSGAGTMDCVTP